MDFDSSKLQRVIYGKPGEQEDFDILASSRSLSAETFALWRGVVTLDPMPSEDAVGIFAIPETNAFLLARVQNPQRPVYEYVAITRPDLTAMSGGIQMLVDHLFFEPIPAYAVANTTVEPYPIPTAPTWTVDRRQVALTYLLSQFGEIKQVLALLGAVLHDRGLLVRGFSPKLADRLDFVQSMMLLLPQIARPDMTFSTHVNDPTNTRARLVFSDSENAADGRWLADFQGDFTAEPQFPDLEEVRSPYVDALQTIWDGDTRSFIAELRAMELVRYPNGKTLMQTLTAVAERYLQDRRVMNGVSVPVEQVKSTFSGDESFQTASPELRGRYAELLLQHALDTRDPEASALVTRLMDEDSALDEQLNKLLQASLERQPDAVYFAIRTHLSQGDTPINQRWLPRLQTAALHSLRVAVSDSDTETLSSWLRLIMREPIAYQLGDVLQQGIVAAQQRAREDGDLGAQLLVFAAKRAPNSVEMLLNDPLLVAELPENVAHAVRDYEADAITELLTQSRALYLIVLSRAAAIPQAARAFTPQTIDQLWALRAEEQVFQEWYQPTHILDILLTEAFSRTAADALIRLITLILTHPDDVHFSARVHDVIRHAQERDAMILPNALNASTLAADALQSLVAGAINAGVITQQQMVNLYLQLLDMKSWQRPALPLAEAVARALQQNHALTLPVDRVWRLLQTAADLRSDQIARVMTKRLTADLEKIETERDLTDTLNRLYEQLAWNNGARQLVMQWWREFMRNVPLNRLQQIDKAMEGRKSLEDLRDILQTTLSLRRIFGRGRTLEDFANAIGTAYTILQALSDSFDPAPKQSTSLDQSTLRSELETRRDELTPDERRVLAKNLKELSGLIVEMSDYRSRANLMRREDELERQLMKGEHQPQSAIDMMKWFAGYLEGIQPADEEES